MSLLDRTSENTFNTAANDTLDRYGITLLTGTDFDKFRQYAALGRPEHTIGAPFDHKVHDMQPGKACWFVGLDRNGDVIFLHALRVLPTESMTVASYFQNNFRGFPPPDMDIDLDSSSYRPGPGAFNMRGRIVYSGETWIGGAPGQYRGTGLSKLLGQFVLMTALKELSADYVVGLIAAPNAYKGLCLRLGYMHAEPKALRWVVRGQLDALEGVMVYMSAADIRHMLDLPYQEFASLTV